MTPTNQNPNGVYMIVAQKIRNESFPNEKSLYDMKHRRNSTMSYKSRKPDNNTKPASSQKTGTNDDSYKSRKPDNNTKPASSQKTGTNGRSAVMPSGNDFSSSFS